MNKIIKYAYGVMLMGAVASCSPEEYDALDPYGFPEVGDATITITKDETPLSTNKATISTPSVAGMYPVWYVNGELKSTQNTFEYSNALAGEYEVVLKMANRNGVSQAGVKQVFTFSETKLDFEDWLGRICDKDWHILYTEKGHLGCGASGTDGKEWWSADPNEKKDWGVYDDHIMFTRTDSPVGGAYSYDPGEGGTVYVNVGCSIFPAYNNVIGADGKPADFTAPVDAQVSSFELIPDEYNGETAVYIHFPAETLLPYIPNDATYNKPVYRIESLTTRKMALVCDDGNIAWRMVFTSEEIVEEKEDESFKFVEYTSDKNLWQAITPTLEQIWLAYGDGWTEYGEDSYTYTLEKDKITLHLNKESNYQWQSQYKVNTNIRELSSEKNYAFQCKIKASKDLNATIKICELGPNGAVGSNGIKYEENTLLYIDKKAELVGGETVTISAKDLKGIDLQDNPLMIVFDFGGNPENFDVEITEIILMEAEKTAVCACGEDCTCKH